MELWSFVLKPVHNDIIFCIRSETSAEFVESFHWPSWRVCDGNFTCETDRGYVQQLIRPLLDANLSALELEDVRLGRVDGRTQWFRAMHDVLAGWEATEMGQLDFLNRFSFASFRDRAVGGWPPIACAALAGQPALVTHCASLGCHADATFGHDVPGLMIVKGSTALQIVGSSAPHRQAETMEALILARANVNFRSPPISATPLHFAASRAAVEVLLKHRASVDARVHPFGSLPLATVADRSSRAQVEAVEALLHARADVEPDGVGLSLSALAHASAIGEDPDIVRLLLSYRADPNRQAELSGPFRPLTRVLALVPGKRRSSLLKLLSYVNGTTPLGLAAFYGRAHIVRIMIDAGGDVTVRNRRGYSVADLAAIGCDPFVLEAAAKLLVPRDDDTGSRRECLATVLEMRAKQDHAAALQPAGWGGQSYIGMDATSNIVSVNAEGLARACRGPFWV